MSGMAAAVGFARFAMAVRDLLGVRGVRGVRGAVYQICRGLIGCEVTGVSGQGEVRCIKYAQCIGLGRLCVKCEGGGRVKEKCSSPST